MPDEENKLLRCFLGLINP